MSERQTLEYRYQLLCEAAGVFRATDERRHKAVQMIVSQAKLTSTSIQEIINTGVRHKSIDGSLSSDFDYGLDKLVILNAIAGRIIDITNPDFIAKHFEEESPVDALELLHKVRTIAES